MSVFPNSVTQMPRVTILWVHIVAHVTMNLLVMELPVYRYNLNNDL